MHTLPRGTPLLEVGKSTTEVGNSAGSRITPTFGSRHFFFVSVRPLLPPSGFLPPLPCGLFSKPPSTSFRLRSIKVRIGRLEPVDLELRTTVPRWGRPHATSINCSMRTRCLQFHGLRLARRFGLVGLFFRDVLPHRVRDWSLRWSHHDEVPPRFHQGPPLLQKVGPVIGSLDFVLDGVR